MVLELKWTSNATETEYLKMCWDFYQYTSIYLYYFTIKEIVNSSVHSTEGNWNFPSRFLSRRKTKDNLENPWVFFLMDFELPDFETHIRLSSHSKLNLLYSNMRMWSQETYDKFVL